MRILLLTTHLNVGGIPRYVINLAKFLARKNFVVVATSGGEWEKELVGVSNTVVLNLPIATKSILSPKIAKSFHLLSRFLKKRKVDIVHANTRVTQSLAHRLWVTRKIPYVSTFHGCYRPHLFRKLFPFAGLRTIAVSNYVKDHLIRNFKINPKNIRVIYNGIDISSFPQRSDSIKEKVLPISFSGYPVIGMISRLAPEKNISFFIQSMPLILKKYPEAVALILGEGREELRLKEIKKKLGLDGRVFFLKKLPSLVVLRNLDIFLSLTEGEPFGFSVVEAQYMGTPVVVANSGALKEIVEDRVTGIILKTTTPRDILEAIDLLLKDNDLRRRIVANAKKMVEERFSLEKMGKSTSQVYEEVLSQ